MSAHLTLRQQTGPRLIFPGHHVARGVNKGCHAPLAYFCLSVSCGCSAGSSLRNAAAAAFTHPCTLHPSTITFMFLAQAQAANAVAHWYKWKQKRLCTKNTHRRSNSPAGFIFVNRSLPVVKPTCLTASALPLCFQWFKATAGSSLCGFLTLSLAFAVPVCVILSTFWHVALQKKALYKDVCVFLVSLISSSLLPVALTFLSQHSAHWLSTNRRCQSFFTPAASGWGGRGGGRGLFAGEELELALMLASGLWSTQLRGIRSTVHLSAALQWNNISCPTNLHPSSSPPFSSQIHRNHYYYKWKNDENGNI